MKILGIDFVPINTPIRSHLEALAAGAAFFFMVGLLPTGVFFTIYMLFFSKYWYLFCVYLFWIWIIDKETPLKGGRRNTWVLSWSLFKYVRSYFPIKFETVPGFYLDPKRNYMSCSFPHGYMPMGTIFGFLTDTLEEINSGFKHHISHGATLNGNFMIPLYREFLLAIGCCSCSSGSLEWLLSYPKGGKIIGVVVGGAAESFHSQTGQYRIVLKNRKGFIKLAIRNGCSIVPSFAFGQNDSLKQLTFPEGSFIRNIQEWLKGVTGVAFVMVYGRGLFQRTFGFIPLQNPINVVAGKPIEITKIEQPTQEDIDRVHAEFIESLTQLFEEYKYKYEPNPEESTLIIS